MSAWIEASRASTGAVELNFHVHNASQMPIYEVSVRSPVADGDEPDEAEFIGLVRPGRRSADRRPRSGWPATTPPKPSRSSSSTAADAAGPRNEQGALS